MGRKRAGTKFEKPKGSGVWYVALTLRSRKRWTERVPPHPSGRPITERQADAYKVELVRMYEAGEWDPERPAAPAPPPVPTLAEYAVAWAAGLTHTSGDNDRNRVEHHLVGTALGAMRLDAVSPPDVAAWVNELRAKASPRGGTLASSTVRSIHSTLHRCLGQAVFEGLLTFNPAVLPRGKLPKIRDKVPGARRTWGFERDEVVEFISDVHIPMVRRVIYGLLFFGGPRASEMLVLRWSDYLPTAQPLGRLTAERAMKETRPTRDQKAERFEGETKTGAVKLIPVHPTLAGMLAEWKLSGWAKLCGRVPREDDLIVPTRKGTARHRENVHHALRGDCTRLGIRPRRLHGARRTFISLAVEDGARESAVKQITHPVPEGTERESFLKYLDTHWRVLCAEMVKLRIYRRGDKLPLWKAASGGGVDPFQTDSATAIATVRPRASSDTGKEATSHTASPPRPGRGRTR